MTRVAAFVVAFLAMALALGVDASHASAHLGLISPPSRYGSGILKEGPCGMTGGPRSDNVTVFEPGQTIEISWDEYIDHPSHYRVAFDPDGVDDLLDPACLSGCDTRTPEIELNTPGVMVLMDGIPDRRTSAGDSTYTVTVTLPDIECDNCTLQVIQVMYDKPPQTRPGNDIYFQCADLILRRGGGADAGPIADAGAVGDGGAVDAGPTISDGGGCGCRIARTERGGGWLFVLAPLAALALRRRGLDRRG